MRKKYWLLIPSLLVLFSLNSSAQDWVHSVGVNYRTFGDVDFKRFAFASSFPDSPYVNGAIVGKASFSEVTVVNGFEQQIPGATDLYISDGVPNPVLTGGTNLTSQIGLDSIEFTGGNEELDKELGYMFQASRLLDDVSDIEWNLDITLGFVSTDASTSLSARSDSNSFEIDDPIPLDNQTIIADLQLLVQDPDTSPGQGLAVGNAAFDVDLDMLTIGVGIGGVMRNDTFGFTFGFGPTFSIADAQLKISQQVNQGGASVSTIVQRDDGDDFIFGLYASLGLQVDVSDTIGLGVGYRYDFAFSDLDTRLTEIEVDGSSLELKVLFTY